MNGGQASGIAEVVIVPDVFVQDDDALSTLACGRTARLLDHPGRTVSDPIDRRWDSVADLAQHHLGRLRANPGPGPMVLVGAGFGGWVAMEMAMRGRELFGCLILVAPYGVKFGPPVESEFTDILLLDTDEVLAAGWADVEQARGLRLPGFPMGLEDDLLADVFQERAMLAQLAWKPFLHDPRLGRWLDVLDLPTLVVSGAEDGLVAPTNTRALAEALPHSTLVEIADAGHYPYLEHPQAFSEVVRPFIDMHREA